MRRLLAALLPSLVFALPVQAQEKPADARGAVPPPVVVTSLDGLWASYVRAERAGDAENARKLFQEIQRLRIERNIESLEPIALALVAQGLERLGRSEREPAEALFSTAVALDPHLPDAHFGLALSELKKGPLGLLPAARKIVSGILARFSTTRGRYHLLLLVVPVVLVTLFLTTAVVALALLLRHGTLLLHDLQESLGSGAVAVAFFAFLLLIPSVAFQGWAWLPLWWMALLFVYLSRAEKALVVMLVLAAVALGPMVTALQLRTAAARNPLFWAGVQALEEAADLRSIAEVEAAARRYPDDRDFVYLLAALYRKAGRYEDAAALYRGILSTYPQDGIARNNLANLDFARGDFPAALASYKHAAEGGGSPEVMATLYYNESQAHFQKFEYPAGQEARSRADRLAGGRIAGYDRLWRYDKGDYAVVDLGLSPEQVTAKFVGTPEGVAVKNMVRETEPGSAEAARILAGTLNRLAGFAGVFLLVVLALSAWRGRRMFTMHCLKCGTAFCRRCHLGAVAAGLCSQCHHLFMVRDGVSGPARNRKLLEVQAEDDRRGRMFRVLSLLSPGAGHVYTHRPLLGALFILLWSGTLVAAVLAGRLLPVTEAPRRFAWPWGLALAAILLAATYALANRMRPDFEVAVPVGRGSTRRARAS